MKLFVTADSLRDWAEKLEARSVLPHVIRRLVSASVNGITELDFPAYESVQRPGFDGVVDCSDGNAWVPKGRSVWELSTEDGVRGKATRDFDKRTIHKETSTSKPEQERSVYVYLTPRRFNQKKEWAAEQSNRGHWREVRAYDADDLEQWTESAPAGVQSWLGRRIGSRPEGVIDLAAYWSSLSSASEHSLTPEVFIAGRDSLAEQIEEWLSSDPCRLALTSRSPVEVIDFFAAAVARTPIDRREAIESRAVIVRDVTAWADIVDTVSASVLVVDPALAIPDDDIVRAVNCGHHVLLAADPSILVENRDSEIPRAKQFELAKALEDSGYSPAIAEQFSRACGGSLAVLKHRLSPIGRRKLPEWSSDVSSGSITASLLLGGWENGKPDVEIFARIAGRPYEECQVEIQQMASSRNPLLLHAANKWRLISKDHAWSLFEDQISPAAIARFEKVAVEVLADDDPRYELPEDERLYANIRGHVSRFSGTVKQHVAETLAFLGEFGNQILASSSVDVEATVNRIVSEVLSPTTTWHRWASLGSRLPQLAEASPSSFLRAVREDLQRAEPETEKLLHEEEDAMFGRCNHSGLLWAFEELAWSKDHLPEVIELLLKLIELDTGKKRWGNRPKNSLCEILSYWMPQTTASVEQRIKALDLMIRTNRETAWEVLLGLLPKQSGGVSHPTYRPYWRSWANDWKPGVTRGESMTFITATAERVITQAGLETTRWKNIFENLGRFPYTTRDQFHETLELFVSSDIDDLSRKSLSEVLSKQINQHRHFKDAQWAIPEDLLDRFDKVLEALKPRSDVLRNAWLFERWPDRFYERGGSVERNDKAVEAARARAIVEILESDGFTGICELVGQVESPYNVGWALADVTNDKFLEQIIPSRFEGDARERDFAGGFAWKRFYPDNWDWIDAALKRCNTDRSAANLLFVLRLNPDVWNRAAQRGDDVNELYWSQCRAYNPDLTGEELSFALGMLLKRQRPVDAMDMVSMAIHGKIHVDSDFLCRCLEGLLELPKVEADTQSKRLDHYHIQEIIAELQARDDVDPNRLIQLEWHFIQLLDRHSRQSPKTLHTQLAKSPEFFHDVLSACFRSRNEPESSREKPTDHDKYMAEHAFHLLHEWDHIPGTQDDGSIDENALMKWCKRSRELAIASGRIEVCDVQIGEMLARSSVADPDGSWPCQPIRNVIEEIATDSLCSGLSCGIHNSRGATWRVEGGKQERDLSQKYRGLADKIRFDSPVTAKLLSSVAESYDREGDWWDEREKWGD